VPFSTPEGFGSKSVAAGNDVSPAPIVRELIQNSLDAGQLAGRSRIEVSFVFDEVPIEELPGFREYKEAFKAAEEAHKEYLGAVEAQHSRFTESLKSLEVPVLHVIDNGIGLDAKRMNALLGDGATIKTNEESNAAGSYGLGHFTAFPASNLQYILYGGVIKDGSRCASAHAILASHRINNELKGKDGYFVTGTKNDVRDRYVFPKNGQIPLVIDRILSTIERNCNSGSVISITAFNSFMAESDEEDPEELILAAAAKHFFPAIYNDKLAVTVRNQNGVRKELRKSELQRLLEEMQSEMRTRDSISGKKAYAAYQTLFEGERKLIETGFGSVEIYMRQTPNDKTRVSLFRNGMYITDKLPRNQSFNFAKFKPFNAVILLNPPDKDSKSQAFNLIRKAEGEHHTDIKKQRLAPKDRKDFDDLFKSIQENLRKMAVENSSESFVPQGFMPITVNSSEEISHDHKKNRSLRKMDSSKVVQMRFTEMREESLANAIYEDEGGGPHLDNGIGTREEPGSGDAPGDGKGKKSGKEDGEYPKFDRKEAVPGVETRARFEENRVVLWISAANDIENAAIWLMRDGGSDPSCTFPIEDSFVKLGSYSQMDNVSFEDSAYVRNSKNDIYELRLGRLSKGEKRRLSIQIVDPIPSGTVLKVNVVDRKTSNQG